MNEQIEHYANKLKYEVDSSDLYELQKNKENIVILDTRSKEVYDKAHIPSAINFPHRTMNEETTKDLDKSCLYISYCDGIGCNASTKGALNMSRLGFNVKELMGGIDWWIRDGYATKGTQGQEENKLSCGC